MLEFACPLSPDVLSAIAALEQQVVAADGGRLKLEWGTLRARAGKQPEDILYWQDGRLVGFLGLYAFGPPDLELLAMVSPDARRGGIGTALLEAALPLARDRGYSRALLVVPGQSSAGRHFAVGRGAALEHSEHALALTHLQDVGPSNAAIGLRRAGPPDAEVVGALLAAAFGHRFPGLVNLLADPQEQTLVIEVDGAPVGTLRLTRTDDEAGVYGFAVDPRWQGRGIGREVLHRVCRRLLDDGAARVGLEVVVGNAKALNLYTSVGFKPVTTEDYYALPLA